MDTCPSQDSSLDYISAADTCDVQSTESWLGLGGSEEAGVGPSRRHMASSPMSISDSPQCMALDSDFSGVEDDLGVALKTRRRGNIREAGPLLGANDATLLQDLEEPAVSIVSGPSKCADQAEDATHKVWAADWNVVHHHTLPDWLKDNDFLLSGHRAPTNSFLACFKSIFRIHTETGNIWTHLLGMIAFLGIAVYFLTRPMTEVQWQEKAVFSTFFLSAIVCLGFSTLFHTLNCHSHHVGRFVTKLDYCGIVLLIVGSFVPWLYYGFYCRLVLRFSYMALVLALGSACVVVSMMDTFSQPRYRPLRAVAFMCVGLSGVIPTVHFIVSFGFWHGIDCGLGWLTLMAVLYLCGTVFYALRIPECICPGKFDIWFQSHQLWHLFVLAGAFVQYHGISQLANYRLTRGGCVQEGLS